MRLLTVRKSLPYSLFSSICVFSSCRRTTMSMSMSTAANTVANASSSKGKRIAAIAQLRSTSNKYENLLNIAKCAKMAKEQGACMLFLPECFGFLGESSIQTLEQAEDPITLGGEATTTLSKNDKSITQALIDTLQDATTTTSTATTTSITTTTTTRIHLLDGLRTIAKESGLWISGGGMHESGAPPFINDNNDNTGNNHQPRVYNTHVIIDNFGTVQAIYRKMHLFDVSIPGKVELKESKTTAPGTDLVVCNSPIGILGLSTCYDVRFPELYIRLVQQYGAQILLVPSAFTVPTGAAHWHVLLRARAIESQCYVIAAAQYGQHNEKRQSFGHSLAVDPWGTVIADAGGYGSNDDNETNNVDVAVPEPPSIVTCEIDLEGTLESIRQRMPIALHRSNAPISL